MRKYKISIIIISLSTIVYIVLSFLPIFDVSYLDSQMLYEKVVKEYKDDMVILAKYQYSTGANWLVINCNNEQLVSQNIVLYTYLNPRLLKDNSDYFMDYTSKYIIIVKKVATVNLDGEAVIVIKPKKIIVNNNFGEKKVYLLKDFSARGILKFILAIISKNYRYCY